MTHTETVWVNMLGGTVEFIECSGLIDDAYHTRVMKAGEGDDPPLIMMHGLGGHAEAHIRNVVTLAEQLDREVYSIDFVGHGYSSALKDLEYHIPDYLDHVEDFIRAIGHETAHLSGESLGGWVAGRMGLDRPELVETVCMNTPGGVYSGGMDPNGTYQDSLKRSRAGLEDLYDRTIDMLDAGVPREGVKHRMDWLFLEPADDELIDIRQRIYTRPEIHAVIPTIYWSLLKEDVFDDEVSFTVDELQDMDVPAMIIHTEDNPSAQKELVQHMADLIPDCEFHLYEESGHWPQYEQHELFNRHQAEFIKNH